MSSLSKTSVFFFICLLTREALTRFTIDSLPEHLIRHARSTGLVEDKFTHFDVTSFVDKSTAQSGRKKRNAEFQENEIVELEAFGDIFKLRLSKAPSVLHPDAAVKFSSRDDVYSLPVVRRDCHWSGEIVSHNGSAVFSTCCQEGGVMGTLVAGKFQYHVQSLPVTSREKRSTGVFGHQFIVARKELEGDLEKDIDGSIIEAKIRERRQVTGEKPKSIAVEIAVFLDADFTARLISRGMTSPEQRLNFVVLKWNSVQYNFNRPELGYDIALQLKLVHFYVENEPWYVLDTGLTKTLQSVCNHQKDGPAYDVIVMQSGIPNASIGGNAYVGGACSLGFQCAVAAEVAWGAAFVLSHELGHLFGLLHTSQTQCAPDENEVGGIMGGGNPGWSPCSVEGIHNFIQSDKGQCFYEENVPSEPPNNDVITLGGLLPGMYETRDQSCEGQYGLGFRYWPFPKTASLDECSHHTCLNTNIGPHYGQMILRSRDVVGMYCAPGKACLPRVGCLTYKELLITDPVPTRAGGWSAFEPFLPVSRSCGTGARVAQRKCNNPIPLNSADCDGEEYKAELGNTHACPEDVDDFATIRRLRASEVCRKLLRNGLIDSSVFTSEGLSFKDTGFGQCEVQCRRYTGSNFNYMRWGLYDDGVPCKLDMPRSTGLRGHCIRGHCKAFGCDGKFPGKKLDSCGVCGGDDSTCDVISDVNMQQEPGSRVTVVDIPAGSYNIEVTMERQRGGIPRMFLELWSKDDEPVFVQRDWRSRVSHTEITAIFYAGTQWDYHSREFLVAKGPIDQPLSVKVFQSAGSENTGIAFNFSIPLSNQNCNPACQNGGTKWKCGCRCPAGFGGIDCSITSKKVCFNGAKVDPATGECQCNERQFGSLCSCGLPYKGNHCSECKIRVCQNCGVFNHATCRCECPEGYGGLQCELKPCRDLIGGCNNRKANGNCESDQAFMEKYCPLTCGYCQASPTGTVTEAQCPSDISIDKCTHSEFECSDKQCIDLRLVGDGKRDCADGSDEPTEAKEIPGFPWSLGREEMQTNNNVVDSEESSGEIDPLGSRDSPETNDIWNSYT